MKKITILLFVMLSLNVFSQNVEIPDLNLKDALLNHVPVIDVNNDGEIQIAEAENFTQPMNLSQKSIVDITGLEYFINVSELNIRINDIEEMDLSSMENLKFLDCSWNNLTAISVRDLSALEVLYCHYNEIRELDISYMESLVVCYAHKNSISNLKFHNCPSLEVLHCKNNLITKVVTKNVPMLKDLRFSFNPLESLYLEPSATLNILQLNGTNLKEIDLSLISNLNSLNFSDIYGLSYINLKNGNNSELVWENWNMENNGFLHQVCVDDENSDLAEFLRVNSVVEVLITSDCESGFEGGNLYIADIGYEEDRSLSSQLSGIWYKVLDESQSEIQRKTSSSNGSIGVLSNEDILTVEAIGLPSEYEIEAMEFDYSEAGPYYRQTVNIQNLTPIEGNDFNVDVIPVGAYWYGNENFYRYVTLLENVKGNSIKIPFKMSYDASRFQSIGASYPMHENTNSGSHIVPMGIDCQQFELYSYYNEKSETDSHIEIDILGDDLDDSNNHCSRLVNNSVTSWGNCLKAFAKNDSLFADIEDQYLYYVVHFVNETDETIRNLNLSFDLPEELNQETFRVVSSNVNYNCKQLPGENIIVEMDNFELKPEGEATVYEALYFVFRAKISESLQVGDIIYASVDISHDGLESEIVSNEIEAVKKTYADPTYEKENSQVYSCYPNPIQNSFKIVTSIDYSHIEIMDIHGRVVSTFEKSIVYDLEDLQSGMYVVRMYTEEGIYCTELLKK
jgi:hypothetical protein